ncbi:MAG: alcohol dehydrogenase catalytic domain-containing protein [Chloroflexi bacterium]|nr:alcohol dehydrogenase catalytic domain-containing protein [Chloroflexota bacterium]
MRAVVLEAAQHVVVADVGVPQLEPGEVLVRIERAGVCGSDVAVFSGKRQAEYPLIMGHEAVGTIVDSRMQNRPVGMHPSVESEQNRPVGMHPTDAEENRPVGMHPAADAVKNRPVGMRVVIEPNIPCGTCRICCRGLGNVCPFKRSLGMNSPGAFADYVAIPAEFVHPLPDNISWEDAVGIEPLAVAVHAIRTSGMRTGEEVAVVGCGAEGLLLVQVAVAHGARVLAADLHPEPLAQAREMGAEETLVLGRDGAADYVATHWCPSVVFEAAGASAALEFALSAVAPGGKVVGVGLGTTPVEVVPLQFVRRGLSLVASLIYDHPTDFLRAIELVSSGQIRPSSLLTRSIDLEELPSAFVDGHHHGKMQVRLR